MNGILDNKKEEISPKIPSFELNLYSIHTVVIIVILNTVKIVS